MDNPNLMVISPFKLLTIYTWTEYCNRFVPMFFLRDIHVEFLPPSGADF